ncbi:hypothetical protein BB560_005265 [Smittium megazygosporum]|uniref:AB hydrolase-1 domain-containing protein n=1 Tax=Smittium megazygosporum TaxID=133381 RepID=A0A2T9Z6X6_9FUNG|nr:hypothetical protein BB560_005265 [Smittium megazygosporum]
MGFYSKEVMLYVAFEFLALCAIFYYRQSIFNFVHKFFGIHISTSNKTFSLKKKYIEPKTKVLEKNVEMIKIVNECPSIQEKTGNRYLLPSPLVFNGHIQTLYNSYLTVKKYPVEGVSYGRELMNDEDGGTFSIDWCPPLEKTPLDNRPIVFVVPGISGGSHEYYVKTCVQTLVSPPYSYRCVVINYRGCSRTPLTTRLMNHGGFTADVRHVIQYVMGKASGSLLFGVGFSIGANILLKYVGEEGENCPLTAVSSISNPIDLGAADDRSEESGFMNKYIYTPYLTKALVNVVDKNKHILSTGSTTERYNRIKKVME